ncbi:MaoC/PaaZ C-terminal domain-containing protein [Nocardioides pocheonensis]|nr:MaoC/PaaZ C-terminal domain-containing protein [Nocardioides pocheonensis]
MTPQTGTGPLALETGIDPNVRHLDELEVGMRWKTRGRTITEADLVTFGTWSGDMHPLHTDEEYARQTQFGGRIFHGPGALAIAFGLEMSLGWKLGSAIAFLGIREWNLLAPVRMGDTLHVTEEVVELRPSSSKPDRGVVITKIQVLNQDGVVCQEGFWSVLLTRQAK